MNSRLYDSTDQPFARLIGGNVARRRAVLLLQQVAVPNCYRCIELFGVAVALLQVAVLVVVAILQQRCTVAVELVVVARTARGCTKSFDAR